MRNIEKEIENAFLSIIKRLNSEDAKFEELDFFNYDRVIRVEQQFRINHRCVADIFVSFLSANGCRERDYYDLEYEVIEVKIGRLCYEHIFQLLKYKYYIESFVNKKISVRVICSQFDENDQVLIDAIYSLCDDLKITIYQKKHSGGFIFYNIEQSTLEEILWKHDKNNYSQALRNFVATSKKRHKEIARETARELGHSYGKKI